MSKGGRGTSLGTQFYMCRGGPCCRSARAYLLAGTTITDAKTNDYSVPSCQVIVQHGTCFGFHLVMPLTVADWQQL